MNRKKLQALFLAVAMTVCSVQGYALPAYAAESEAQEKDDKQGADVKTSADENKAAEPDTKSEEPKNEESAAPKADGAEDAQTPAAENETAAQENDQQASEETAETAAEDPKTDADETSETNPQDQAMSESEPESEGLEAAAEGDPEDPEEEKVTVKYIDRGKVFATLEVEKDSTQYIIKDILSWEGRIFDYAFCGWSERSDASPSSNLYTPGDSFKAEKDITFYAVWGENQWGSTLTAAGDGSTWVYDGNTHRISGVVERPSRDRKNVNGDGYDQGFYYQDLWYSLNVWRYTNIGVVGAAATDVGSYSTPVAAPMYAEIWVPWPWDNEWVRIEDTYTRIRVATMHITPAELRIKAEDQQEVYTGDAYTPEGTLEGLVTPTNGEQETATLQMDSFTDVGEYPIKGTIVWDGTAKKSNYTLAEEDFGTFTITAAPLSVKAEDQRVRYTGKEQTPEGTLEGLVTPTDGEQETATLRMTAFKEAGAHPMTYTIDWDGTAKESNYQVTEEQLGTFTIYYDLTFDANGGEGAPEPMEVESDTVTLPSAEPKKEDTEFLGWAQSADAEEPEYKAGEKITLTDNTTLYAVYAVPSYSFTKGDGQIWTKGSGKTADFTVKRSVLDGLTYGKFTGVEIDGKTLSKDSYTASQGSVKLSLSAASMEKLSTGDHTITALFSDGSAEASFGVEAKETEKQTEKKATAVKTGDQTPILPYALCMLAAALLIAVLVVRRRKWNR